MTRELSSELNPAGPSSYGIFSSTLTALGFPPCATGPRAGARGACPLTLHYHPTCRNIITNITIKTNVNIEVTTPAGPRAGPGLCRRGAVGGGAANPAIILPDTHNPHPLYSTTL